MCIYIYIYIYIHMFVRGRRHGGHRLSQVLGLLVQGRVFITGGRSRRGVQWIGVALYNKAAYNRMQTTTPCFHCTPL